MSTILVVDDEFDIAQAIKGILEDEGYRVDTCRDGRHALAHLRDAGGKGIERPCLVLLDAMMPFMGGLEVVARLRADAALRDLRVVLMNNAEPRAPGEDRAWDGFLRKPFDLDALLDVVRRHAARSDAGAGVSVPCEPLPPTPP